MKIINRIYEYLEYKDIPPTKFEKDIGLSNGYLGVQRKRSADIGESVIIKIIDNCRDLSLEWLILGVGSMLKSDNPEAMGQPKHIATPGAISDLIDRLVTENTNLATQLGMQIKENEQLHKQNMELLAENEHLTNKAKKVTARPADTMDHYPIAAESKPEYK